MKFFEFKHFVPIISIPTLDSFDLARQEIETVIRRSCNVLTCALWWGSAATRTINITSDLDLVFVYPLKNTERVEILLQQITEIANRNNIPVEVMCLPEEFYFGTREIDLSKFLMIKEYEDLGHSIYVCGDQDIFILEKFGFNVDKSVIASLLKKSYKDYIRHKYDRWMRVSCEWNKLSDEERCLQAGKFISMPAHAIRKFAQSIGENAVCFENCIKEEDHPINHSHINQELLDYYICADSLKKKYLEGVQQYVEGQMSIDSFIEQDYLNKAMKTARGFILLASQEL